jgi:hypothetical protein
MTKSKEQDEQKAGQTGGSSLGAAFGSDAGAEKTKERENDEKDRAAQKERENDPALKQGKDRDPQKDGPFNSTISAGGQQQSREVFEPKKDKDGKLITEDPELVRQREENARNQQNQAAPTQR